MKSRTDRLRTFAVVALLGAWAGSSVACGGGPDDVGASDGSVAGADTATADDAQVTTVDSGKDNGAPTNDAALGSDNISGGDSVLGDTSTVDSPDSAVGSDSADSNASPADSSADATDASTDATDGSGDASDGASACPASCAFGCSGNVCATTVSCTPGAYHCSGGSVELCNSSGTAYLYSSTCVMCASGLCTGSCTPGAKRCNGLTVESCNGAGTAWGLLDTCTTFCDAGTSKCALSTLTIDSATIGSFDGEIVVAGAVLVKSGGTLTSATGNLTLRAQSITVESGGSINIAPTGAGSPAGVGSTGCSMAPGGGSGGTYIGSATDSTVNAGSIGGTGGICDCCTGNIGGAGGKGGGVLRLIANSINIAGQVIANGAIGGTGTAGSGAAGGGGGGSGGGILVAGDALTISGVISVSGGGGGPGVGGTAAIGNMGGLGRVKILHGSMATVTGTVTGQQTQSILPPLTITSTTHPDPSMIYNDDFETLAITWNKAFPSLVGYYTRLDTMASGPPTPANGAFIASELTSFARTSLVAGNNFFHIDSIDGASNVGAVESVFKVQINTSPPSISSSSHPSSTTWYPNNNPFFAWTVPSADANYAGFYYLLDHYGTSVPSTSDTFLPVTQKSLIRSGLADGVWAYHVVSVDQKGYLTKAGGHYRVRIGTNPGSGAIVGKVVDGAAAAVSGAKVTINRGLFNFVGEALDQTTNATGDYSFPSSVPAGSWEVTVSKGSSTVNQMVPVTMNGSAVQNFILP